MNEILPKSEKKASTLEEIGETLRLFAKSAAVSPKVENKWSIVVVGSIDFRQHHPLWYKLIDCINEKEMEAAIGTTQMTAFPPLIHFRAAQFSISSIPDRWQIETTDEPTKTRIVEIACRVFQKLNEINISAFGINAQLRLETKAASVRSVMAKKMGAADIGFSNLSDTSECQFMASVHDGARTTVVRFEASVLKPQDGVMAFDRDHQIAKLDGFVANAYYDVGKWIRQFAAPAWEDAANTGKKFVESINKFAE